MRSTIKHLLLISCVTFFLLSSKSIASESTTMIKIKKSDVMPEDLQYIHAIKMDDQYYYVERTPEQMKLIKQTDRLLKKPRKLAPPPVSLQKKMQDQVGE